MTNHAGTYACVVTLFVQKWYLPALLAIVLYLTLLALLFERYIQRPDRVLQFKLVYGRLKYFFHFKLT